MARSITFSHRGSSPTSNSRPYGLMINSKGVPVVVLFGTNKVATVEPKTMAIKEYPLPDAAARPRRLALEDDNIAYYADFARGYLGRLDLSTGTTRRRRSATSRGTSA